MGAATGYPWWIVVVVDTSIFGTDIPIVVRVQASDVHFARARPVSGTSSNSSAAGKV